MPTPQPAQAAPRVDAKAVAEADAKPRPTTAAVASAQRGTVRHSERVAVINVTCNSKLASCRRWIDQQVAKLART
jgi:hypothetical protein